MRINANEAEYRKVDIFGENVLVTKSCINKKTVPEGIYAYNAYIDSYGNVFGICNFDQTNNLGAVLSMKPIEVSMDCVIGVSPDEFKGSREYTTIDEYMLESMREKLTNGRESIKGFVKYLTADFYEHEDQCSNEQLKYLIPKDAKMALDYGIPIGIRSKNAGYHGSDKGMYQFRSINSYKALYAYLKDDSYESKAAINMFLPKENQEIMYDLLSHIAGIEYAFEALEMAQQELAQSEDMEIEEEMGLTMGGM